MTVSAIADFQQGVYDALNTAFPDLDVFKHVPDSAPDRYLRIDGFTMSGVQNYKLEEQAQHGCNIHVIDAPEQGTNSLSWVNQTMPLVQAAIRGLKVTETARGMIMESGTARLEPKSDNVNDAHGVLRYTTVITGG